MTDPHTMLSARQIAHGSTAMDLFDGVPREQAWAMADLIVADLAEAGLLVGAVPGTPAAEAQRREESVFDPTTGEAWDPASLRQCERCPTCHSGGRGVHMPVGIPGRPCTSPWHDLAALSPAPGNEPDGAAESVELRHNVFDHEEVECPHRRDVSALGSRKPKWRHGCTPLNWNALGLRSAIASDLKWRKVAVPDLDEAADAMTRAALAALWRTTDTERATSVAQEGGDRD